MRAIGTFRILTAALALGALSVLGGAVGPSGAVWAQEKTKRIAAKRDWSIFRADSSGRVCWIVSQPTEWDARRDGAEVKVKRSEIYLMVAVRPGSGVKNEVSFASGYPFAKGGVVKAQVGDTTFDMFTDGEGAWLASSEEDDRMTAAMKRGSKAVLSGTSSRGTNTRDTFSLLGFTAALDEAKKLCS